MHESRTNGINVSICFVTQVIWFRGQLSAWMKRTEYKFPFASLPKQFGLEANFVHEANTEYNLISFDTLVGKNSGVAFTLIGLLHLCYHVYYLPILIQEAFQIFIIQTILIQTILPYYSAYSYSGSVSSIHYRAFRHTIRSSFVFPNNIHMQFIEINQIIWSSQS